MAKNELVVGQSMYDDHYFIDPLLSNAWREFKFRFINKPYTISSVWRSKDVNDAVGGSPSSYHLTGRAIDFTMSLSDQDNLFKNIEKGGFEFFSWLDQYDVAEFTYYQDGHIHFAVNPNQKEKELKIYGYSQDELAQFMANFEKSRFQSNYTILALVAVGLIITLTFKRKGI